MRDRERFSPAQCRAGRGLLGWSVEALARRARLEPEAIEIYEFGEGGLSECELGPMGFAFNRAGVIAIRARRAGEGVRFSRPPDDIDGPSMAAACAAVAHDLALTLTTPPDQRGPRGQ